MISGEPLEPELPHRILVHPEYQPFLSVHWFDATYWGASAQPVQQGGRGSAWFISRSDAHQQDLVLRQYRRGGLIARLSESRYFFTGFDRSRSFREFELLRRLERLGLPVPRAVGACCQRAGMTYQAWLLMERLPDCSTLLKTTRSTDPVLWHEVGQTIRRFHDAGLDHVDLNWNNILVSDNAIYLIDFDRCRLRTPTQGAFRKSNLERLHRSLTKVMTVNTLETLWRSLLEGYSLSSEKELGQGTRSGEARH